MLHILPYDLRACRGGIHIPLSGDSDPLLISLPPKLPPRTGPAQVSSAGIPPRMSYSSNGASPRPSSRRALVLPLQALRHTQQSLGTSAGRTTGLHIPVRDPNVDPFARVDVGAETNGSRVIGEEIAMETNRAVREGDEEATFALLRRMARQATSSGRYPPGADFPRWNDDAIDDLISETFEYKPAFVAAAITRTTTDSGLELYLLETFENALRDRGRRSERGKLIERLKTILGGDPRFVRHTSPYDTWRVATAPAELWNGDIGDLLAAARHLRGVAATAWNNSGPTPKATKDAIVNVSDAALTAADGLVRDGVVAEVVQHWVPATPLDTRDVERTGTTEDVADWDMETSADPRRGRAARPRPVGGSADPHTTGQVDVYRVELPGTGAGDGVRAGAALVSQEVSAAIAAAAAVWDLLEADERRALPHLNSDRGIANALGIGRRGAAAIVASIAAKVRAATAPGGEETVAHLLVTWAQADDAPPSSGPTTATTATPDPTPGDESDGSSS